MKGELVREILNPWIGILQIPSQLNAVLSHEEIPFVNGCGAEDSFLSLFIPQFIDGIDIRAACLIHDADYTWAATIQEKILADIKFEYNLKKIIALAPDNLEITAVQRQQRFDKAAMYFMYVSLYGENAFRAGAGNQEEKVSAYIKDLPELDELERICAPVGRRGSEDPDDIYL